MSKEPNPAAPRILIVRVGAMGDVLHGMPAVAALRAALPEAYIGWAIEPRWSPLLYAQSERAAWQANLPLVDCVHLAETKIWSQRPFSIRTARSVKALRHSLRVERYDIAIDLQGSIRSAVIARMSGASHRTGSATPCEGLARLLYTQRVRVSEPHVIDQAVEIVSAAMHRTLQHADVPLPLIAENETWAEGIQSQREGAPLILIAPNAGWGAKQWPAERFGLLAAQLHGQGYRVMVNASVSGPDPIADQVIAASAGTAERAACTLAQLIALMRRVCLAIVGDSGPLHLAAALRVPVVALFGPTDPARNGPYGTRAAVLRHPSSITSYRHVQHADSGLLRITVKEVLDASTRLLRSPQDVHND